MLKDQGNSGGKLASRFYAVLKQEPFYNQDSLFFLILTQGHIIDLREREKGMGGERERVKEREKGREREKHQFIASHVHPDWRPNLKPRYMP